MRRYYDFLVRYSELFFDAELIDVTTTHLGVEFPDYSVDGVPVSATGEAGRVWVTVHESVKHRVISLVNLIGLDDDRWNSGHTSAPPQPVLRVSARVLERVESIYTASPDSDTLRAQKLPYSRHAGFPEASAAAPETANGEVYATILPELRTWAVIVIKVGR
jgi:dextranase